MNLKDRIAQAERTEKKRKTMAKIKPIEESAVPLVEVAPVEEPKPTPAPEPEAQEEPKTETISKSEVESFTTLLADVLKGFKELTQKFTELEAKAEAIVDAAAETNKQIAEQIKKQDRDLHQILEHVAHPPQPVVNLTVPERRVEKLVERDARGMIMKITEIEESVQAKSAPITNKKSGK